MVTPPPAPPHPHHPHHPHYHHHHHHHHHHHPHRPDTHLTTPPPSRLSAPPHPPPFRPTSAASSPQPPIPSPSRFSLSIPLPATSAPTTHTHAHPQNPSIAASASAALPHRLVPVLHFSHSPTTTATTTPPHTPAVTLQPATPPAQQPPPKRRRTAPLPSHYVPPSAKTPPKPRSQPRSRRRDRGSRTAQLQNKASQNGLKTFTMSVVAKLRQLIGASAYTAVADDLVEDAYKRLQRDGQQYNALEVDKNIRRRVYDALNVLTSMGFVARAGKDVEWKGIAGFMHLVGLRIPHTAGASLPIDDRRCDCRGPSQGHVVSHSCFSTAMDRQRMENERVRKNIAEKRARIAELRSQQACLQQIVTRNASRDSARVTTGLDVLVGDSMEYVHPDPKRVGLPFLMVSTNSRTSITLEMEDHREQMVFRFDAPFQIHEGYNIVGQVCQLEREEQRKASSLVVAAAQARGDGGGSAPWPKVYDGRDGPSSSTDGVLPLDVATRHASSPKLEDQKKRRAPPCFALQRAGFSQRLQHGVP